jgi:hypothetical protein
MCHCRMAALSCSHLGSLHVNRSILICRRYWMCRWTWSVSESWKSPLSHAPHGDPASISHEIHQDENGIGVHSSSHRKLFMVCSVPKPSAVRHPAVQSCKVTDQSSNIYFTLELDTEAHTEEKSYSEISTAWFMCVVLPLPLNIRFITSNLLIY